MFDLKSRLGVIKERIIVQESKDQAMRNQLKISIAEATGNIAAVEKFVRDVYIKNNTLTIVTNHKVFANELFLIRSDLMQSVQAVHANLRDIVIY